MSLPSPNEGSGMLAILVSTVNPKEIPRLNRRKFGSARILLLDFKEFRGWRDLE
jgi:hypothetical protein